MGKSCLIPIGLSVVGGLVAGIWYGLRMKEAAAPFQSMREEARTQAELHRQPATANRQGCS